MANVSTAGLRVLAGDGFATTAEPHDVSRFFVETGHGRTLHVTTFVHTTSAFIGHGKSHVFLATAKHGERHTTTATYDVLFVQR